MELEFDKEIDALLRKARSDTAVSSASAGSNHLDADELSAFAENAMPEKTKQLYFAHFADCDRCRKTLSNYISLKEEAASGAAFAADAGAAVKKIEPWYLRLFALPNLAYIMGAAVLLFSGFLGYLVLQNITGSRNAEVSQISEPEERTSGPNAAEQNAPYLSNSANAMANAANANSNATSSSPLSGVSKSGVAVGSANSSADTDRNELDTVDSLAQPPAADAPAPSPKDLPINGRNKRELQLDGNEKDVAAPRKDDKLPITSKEDAQAFEMKAKERSSEDARAARDLPSAKTAPSRAAGPRQQINNAQQENLYNQQSTGALMAADKKSVGGKTFQFTEGAWYDSAYRGQGTKNFRRGTSDYLKLDGGLRSIADTLGGTVVVVWKEKAYRIQ